jgi:hypothetical protein
VSEFAPREESATEGAVNAPRVEPSLAPRVEQPLARREGQPLAFREDLPVPEPWSKTIWEVVKPLPLSLGLMYGIMHLVMPNDVQDWRWFLQMGGFFAVMGVFQRRKGTFHSQGLLAFGALTLGAAVLIMGFALLDPDRTALAMGLIFAVFGGISLVAGFRARVLERERTARLEADAIDAAPIEGAMPVATLRARMQRFKERMSRVNKVIFAGFASVLGVTFGTLIFGERLGFSDPAYMGVFLFFWAGLGGVMWYSSRVTRKLAREAELECPACTRPLVSTLGSQRLMTQLEDLGRCPQCAARITLEVL